MVLNPSNSSNLEQLALKGLILPRFRGKRNGRKWWKHNMTKGVITHSVAMHVCNGSHCNLMCTIITAIINIIIHITLLYKATCTTADNTATGQMPYWFLVIFHFYRRSIYFQLFLTFLF